MDGFFHKIIVGKRFIRVNEIIGPDNHSKHSIGKN